MYRYAVFNFYIAQVVVHLFSNIIHEQKHQILTWLIKHTQDIVNMYYIEGHQKKP